MCTPSDEAVLAGLGSGQPDLARLFVERFQGRVYGLARSLLRDPHVAEDVAQETFLRAWRHANTYDARKGPVLVWLLTITRNLSIDAMRTRGAEPVEPSALAEMLIATGPSVVDAATQRTEMDRMRDALEEIGDQQRRALVLAAFYGCSAAEIATREGIPLGTAKTRIRSGLRKLRERLAPVQERE